MNPLIKPHKNLVLKCGNMIKPDTEYKEKLNMKGLNPTWPPPYCTSLLIWLSWLKGGGVRWSGNMIYGREHVRVSCTYTRTHVCPWSL